MYEGPTASEHKNYHITINTTPTTVYTLLSSGDRVNYDNLLLQGAIVQPLQYPSLNNDIRYVVPIDGYVVANSGSFLVGTDGTSGGKKETITANNRYPCNVYFWPHKTYFSTATATISATARILFG